jgi:hypothetical protein
MIASSLGYKYSKSKTLPSSSRQSFVIHTESRVWVVNDASDIQRDGSIPHAVMVGRIRYAQDNDCLIYTGGNR